MIGLQHDFDTFAFLALAFLVGEYGCQGLTANYKKAAVGSRLADLRLGIMNAI